MNVRCDGDLVTKAYFVRLSYGNRPLNADSFAMRTAPFQQSNCSRLVEGIYKNVTPTIASAIAEHERLAQTSIESPKQWNGWTRNIHSTRFLSTLRLGKAAPNLNISNVQVQDP